jgi:hypothetical protein
MKRGENLIAKWLCFILSIGLLTTAGESPQVKKTRSQEQSVFGMEQETAPIERPVDIPESVLQILRKSEYVLGCLREGQSPDEIPASWFVGSEIHLNGPDEIDLVAMPRMLVDVPAPNRCLVGANVAGFWIFRRVTQGYELVLEVSAHHIEVLGSRSKGFRDIRTYSSTVDTLFTVTFRFDGQKYKTHQEKTKPIR